MSDRVERFGRGGDTETPGMNSFTTANQRLSEATSAEQRAHEPSMEEILASIRRIIADDQLLPITRPPAPVAESATPAVVPPPVATREADVAQASATVETAPRVNFTAPKVEAPATIEREPEIAPPPRAARPRVEAPREAPVNEPVKSAPRFETPKPPLRVEAATRPEPPKAAVEAPEPAPRQVAHGADSAPLLSPAIGDSVSSAFNALATTMILQNQGMVEEATREMLRPMLKQWLDDNLPGIVERLVRQEIERVARGGR